MVSAIHVVSYFILCLITEPAHILNIKKQHTDFCTSLFILFHSYWISFSFSESFFSNKNSNLKIIISIQELTEIQAKHCDLFS